MWCRPSADHSPTIKKKQTPHELIDKVFGELRERYADRPGGYTRVLRTEPKNTYDQAPSAILEFVDGPKDMRYHMTAAAIAKDTLTGQTPTKVTLLNKKKVLQFRGANAKQDFNKMVERMKAMELFPAHRLSKAPSTAVAKTKSP